jgi:hypothetical protein
MTVSHETTQGGWTDSALRRIAQRHAQDDIWFTGGLHDNNGYVAMAHKDRAALLALLAEHPRPHGQMLIPRVAWDWLMGTGADDGGFHFGDRPTTQMRGQYWWRSIFRRMCGMDGADQHKGASAQPQQRTAAQ